MGLGKTRIVLELLKEQKRKALIIAPLRGVTDTWPKECMKWTPELKYTILHGQNKDVALQTPADLYIVNPEGMKWLYYALKKIWEKTHKLPFTELVIDEGSMWKSGDTKRFDILRALLPIFRNYRIILSGTPAPNSLLDLWSQYYILDEGQSLYGEYTRYRGKYFRQIDMEGRKFEVLPGKETEIYNKIAPRTFRLQAEDYLELPEIIYNTISCEMPQKIVEQYTKLEDQFFLDLIEGRVTAFNAASLASKLRQFVQGGIYHEEIEGQPRQYQPIHHIKLDRLRDLVDEHEGESILCAIQFRFELDMLHLAFPDAPTIVGGMPAKVVQQHIDDWNNGKIPLLICHPASISHSVNLQTGGHIVLWYGLPWSLEKYQQLIGRLYRQGQQHAVIVHHLVMQDTIDEAIIEALAHRHVNQMNLLNFLKEYKHGR